MRKFQKLAAEMAAYQDNGPDGLCWFVPLSGRHGKGKFALVGIEDWKKLKRRGITKLSWRLWRMKGYFAVVCSRGLLARLILNARKGKDEVRYSDNADRTNLLRSNISLQPLKKAKSAKAWHRGKRELPEQWERYTCESADLVRKPLTNSAEPAILDWADFKTYCIDFGIANLPWGIGSGGKVVRARVGDGSDVVVARVIMEAAGKRHDGFSEEVSYRDGDHTHLRRANLEKKRGGSAYYNDYKRLMALRGAPTND